MYFWKGKIWESLSSLLRHWCIVNNNIRSTKNKQLFWFENKMRGITKLNTLSAQINSTTVLHLYITVHNAIYSCTFQVCVYSGSHLMKY